MIPPLGLAAYATGLLLAVAAGAALACRARPTALRGRSLAIGAAGVLVVRLLAAGLEGRLGDRWELIVYVAFLLVAATGIFPGEVWLVRSPGTEAAAKLEAGCRGLLLSLAWPTPSRFVLPARGTGYEGRLLSLGSRVSLLWLPTPEKRGKPRLLVNWLAKQYPGPFPRPRIALRRRQS